MDTRSPDADKRSLQPSGRLPLVGEIGPRARLAGGIGLILIILGLAWYRLGQNGNRAEAPPPPVRIASAEQRTMSVVERTIGTVIANATVQMTARVGGQLVSAPFKEGDIVQAGQLLFQIDPRPFQAALQQAEAQLAKDKALLVSARNDKRRFDALFAQNAASSEQRDQADANAGSLAATVKSDSAAVELAQLNLGYTQIHAPFTGKSGPILIQPGNMVLANSTSALVTITQIQPLKVSFALPQSDLPRIQARARAGALIAAVDVHGPEGAHVTAPVDFVSNAVSNQTGTIELRATFANNDYRLVPGQLVDVTVGLNTLPNSVVVPRNAVNTGPDRNFVYVLDKNDKVSLVPVDVLFDDGTDDAIKGNVRRGDRVITEGQLRVVPGISVAVMGTATSDAARNRAPGAQ